MSLGRFIFRDGIRYRIRNGVGREEGGDVRKGDFKEE